MLSSCFQTESPNLLDFRSQNFNPNVGVNVINLSLTRFRTSCFGIEIAIEIGIEQDGIAVVFDFDSDPDFDDLNEKSISFELTTLTLGLTMALFPY